MLTGREQETAFLENHYKRTGSQILVVYGQRGVGKTALLTSFTEKKQTLRYSAGNCSSREQQYLWGRELRSRGKTAVFEIEPDGAVIEEYKQDRCVSQIVKICGGGTKILYERGAI